MFSLLHLQDRLPQPTPRKSHLVLVPFALFVPIFLSVMLGGCIAGETESRPLVLTAGTVDAAATDRLTSETRHITSTETVLALPLVITSTDSPDSPSDLSDLEIYMEKTACEGPCPVYSVAIAGDGAVRYSGKTCVNVVGEQDDQMAPVQVQELVDTFYQNDFFSLEDVYAEDIEDIPSLLIRFTLHGQSKQVFKRVYNSSNAPAELDRLEDAIDSAANTQQWVTSNGTPAPCP